ncbi:MAG TPA: hypothetical protein VG759_16625 [Candidatus Angelobacter sp.]|jgi:hypothetical protein|nr:hypothetical protein [Candidatus Angelobacter sp.]
MDQLFTPDQARVARRIAIAKEKRQAHRYAAHGIQASTKPSTKP